MYTVNVRRYTNKLTYKFRDYPLPHTFKFAKYPAYLEFMKYLKENKITDYTATVEKRHPILKTNTGSSISINGIIGGQDRL